MILCTQYNHVKKELVHIGPMYPQSVGFLHYVSYCLSELFKREREREKERERERECDTATDLLLLNTTE